MDATGILDYFKKLNKRQKTLVIALVSVIAVVAVYRIFVQSYFSEQKKFKTGLQKVKNDIEAKKLKLPDVASQEKELAELRREYEKTVNQIKDLEANIPSVNSVSRLLGEITGRAEGLGMDFESIKQDMDRDKEGYLQLKLNMKFFGSYSSAVNYLNRLQNMSEYLSVSNIEIAHTKEGGSRPQTNLELSMLLLEKGIDLSLDGKEKTPPPMIVKSDPFTSKKGPKKDVGKDLKLAGITWSSAEPTAIINNDVVKIGAQVEEWKVVKILPDAVILSDGFDTISLTVNR